MAFHECYIVMLEMEDHQQTMCIEKQRTIAKLVEELEEVAVNESRPEWTTRMGMLAGQPANTSSPCSLPQDESRCVCIEP